jgi:hypothetical protein
MMERMDSSMIYLIYCKEFFKHHNVSPPSTKIKKKEKNKKAQVSWLIKIQKKIITKMTNWK